MQDYQPSKSVLKKYADVLVKYALNSGAGVKPGEVVYVQVPDVAKPLLVALEASILEAGAHPMLQLLPTGIDKQFYDLASDTQLKFFPRKYLQERVKLIDHQIGIIADTDLRELAEVDPQKLMLARNSKSKYRIWLMDKEYKGKFTWTIAMWGTPAMAAEAGLSQEEYWEQIIMACFLDKPDPIAEWREVAKLQKQIKAKLNKLNIASLQVVGDDADLTVKLGPERIWNGGSGRNIPSFELFTSPDWRGTQGWIRFNQPIYRYGNEISGVELEFKNGRVSRAQAKVGNKMLQEMLKTKNADKIGEYSLTDKRLSRISKPMAEILFDENIGGPYGNTHLAIGSAYKDCYRGDPKLIKKAQWKKMGYNDSVEHTDFISTVDRTVIATFADGKQKVIYQDGLFTV